jgi:hypothetical protein
VYPCCCGTVQAGQQLQSIAALLGCQLVRSAQQLAVVMCGERPAVVVCLVSQIKRKGSQIKRKVLKYNDALDDYLLLSSSGSSMSVCRWMVLWWSFFMLWHRAPLRSSATAVRCSAAGLSAAIFCSAIEVAACAQPGKCQ